MGSKRRTSSSAYSTIGLVAPVVFIGAVMVLVVGCEPDPLSPVSDVEFAQTGGGAAHVLIGAGDMVTCADTKDEATADIIESVLAADPDALAFTAGDNVYEDGTAQEYAQCYEPSWGRFKDRTWATIGNHEYNLGDADPTFDYFGDRIGPRDKAYYSLDVGNWHVVMLNSNSSFVSVGAGSPQEQWLRADLAANTKACVLAIFHHPRFYSSNTQGSFASGLTKPFWDALYEYGAEVIINGHQHHYERFAPQDPDGNADPASGIREFIVGTGGRSVAVRPFQAPNSEALNDEPVFGVLKLTLLDYSYEWEFIPIPGYSFTDSGSGTCSGASGAPIADFAWIENPDRTLAFTDNSGDPDGTLTDWNWDFGDGATSTSQNPTHTYSTAGVYTVTLTVTDNDGLTATSSKSVTAGPQAPVAEFTWTANGLSVDFTDASTDSDGTVTGWNWDFGDGATSSAQSPSHSYAADGSYTVTLTVTDDGGATGTTTQTVNVASRSGDIIYLTSTGSGLVGGVSFEDEDILAYDSDTDSWSVYFDGSGVGLDGSNDRDVRAFALLANGDILLTLNNATTLPDVGSVDPSDILRFSGSTGLNTTSGTFSFYLRGADVGLTGEEIDAISFAPDGRLVISMSGSFNVPGVSGGDEDLIALDPGGTSWSMYFDGSDVNLNDSSSEDVAGIWIDGITGDIYLSTRGDFSVPGVSGDSATVFVCTPSSLGSATACSYASYWSGPAHGLTSNNVIGLHIGKSNVPVNVPPSADFGYNCGDLDCEFNDASSDADGVLTAWSWDFGDGFNSTAPDASHNYASAGTYTVTLTVTDDDGASDTAMQSVTVTEPPPPTNQAPTASFSWTANNLAVDFSDTSSDSDGSVTAWSWDFGDSGSSTLQNPSHTYAAAGSYTVTLTVTDDDGATTTTTQSVSVSEAPPTNQAPTANFSWTANNLSVDFSDTSSDSDGSVVAWSWDFGDSGSSTLQNPSHTYTAAGSYTVTLTVTDDDGATNTATQSVAVSEAPPPNQPPTASFTWSATDLTVDFTDSSIDSDGSVVAWSWDFGDSGSSSLQYPSHTYAAAGTYTVTLTVTDDDGATNTATQSLSVTEPPPTNQPPTASFGWSATNLTVGFSDTSSDSDGSIVAWSWDFGDGTTSTLQNPSHTFAVAGSYTVTLTVTDDLGATSQITETVSMLTVSGVTPNTAAAGTSIDVTISGAGFVSGATLTLENGGGPAPSVVNVVVQNGTTITATLEIKGGGPPHDRQWDVRATNPNGSSGVLVAGFTVTNSK